MKEDRFAEDRSDEGSRQLEVGHPVEVVGGVWQVLGGIPS